MENFIPRRILDKNGKYIDLYISTRNQEDAEFMFKYLNSGLRIKCCAMGQERYRSIILN